MSKGQRLDIEQSNFYKDAQILITCTPKQVATHVAALSEKYKISRKAVYYRIRSKYGKKIAELRKDYKMPSRETLLYIVRNSEDSGEVKQKLGLTDWEFKGIYDKVLGVSTFLGAKTIAISEMVVNKHTPSHKDNISMIAGMRLGDGSVDPRRKAIRIEHCAKQKDWLQTKVNLFSDAYPYVNTEIRTSERSFGTVYRWSSRKLNGDALRYSMIPKIDLPNYLTNIGIFILFMDDGNYGKYGYSSVLGFAVENMQFALKIQTVLNSYGYNFKIETEHYISIKVKTEIAGFLNDFIRPFDYLIPQCMRYKTTLKV